VCKECTRLTLIYRLCACVKELILSHVLDDALRREDDHEDRENHGRLVDTIRYD
jgi:hypothetical protein